MVILSIMKRSLDIGRFMAVHLATYDQEPCSLYLCYNNVL